MYKKNPTKSKTPHQRILCAVFQGLESEQNKLDEI